MNEQMTGVSLKATQQRQFSMTGDYRVYSEDFRPLNLEEQRAVEKAMARMKKMGDVEIFNLGDDIHDYRVAYSVCPRGLFTTAIVTNATFEHVMVGSTKRTRKEIAFDGDFEGLGDHYNDHIGKMRAFHRAIREGALINRPEVTNRSEKTVRKSSRVLAEQE